MTYHLFVQESKQGSGKLLDMLLLQMTLARDARREGARDKERWGGGVWGWEGVGGQREMIAVEERKKEQQQ